LNAKYQRSLSGRFFSTINWKRKKMNLEDEVVPDLDFLADLGAHKRLGMKVQEDEDLKAATEANDEQYQQAGQALECSCCFGEFAFEGITHCEEGHLYCTACAKRFLQEQLFGERSRQFKELCCFSSTECHAPFSPTQIERIVGNEADLLNKYYHDLFLQNSMSRSLSRSSTPIRKFLSFF